METPRPHYPLHHPFILKSGGRDPPQPPGIDAYDYKIMTVMYGWSIYLFA